MSSDEVVQVSRDGAVGIIRLADERKRNALSTPLRSQLMDAYYAVAGDPDVRAIYLTGSGRAFCGGGDLRMMREEGDAWTSHQRLNRTGRWLTDLLRCPKPVVVGVNGVAVGGGIGLALAGDVILAARESASFMAGFMRLGLIPDVGVMYTLPRMVGLARAKAFVFANQTWTAQEAFENGLVHGVVDDADLDSTGLARAHELAAGPIEGFGLAKWLMTRSYETSMDEMMGLEDLGQSLAYTTEAVKEGVAALVDKRTPDFAAATERENATQVERRRRS